MKKTILVAAAELSARFPEKKGGDPVRQVIKAGTPLTPDLIKKFGLTDEQIDGLKARGHVVEQSAHVVNERGGPSAAELAAETKRADAAEAKAAELTAALDEANAEGDDLAARLGAARALLTPEQLATLDDADTAGAQG